jgi:SAM-dependent methyltransferase
MSSTYIHGTEPSEQERLATLNRISNRQFIEFLAPPAGARVLEVGSGLGILATEAASTASGVRVVGVEQSPAQLAAAARHAHLLYVRGDAHHLAFADESFDLVYARYVLEHVADPVAVAGEMRRVARAGARVAACENDVSLLRIDPPCSAFEGVWAAFQEYQRRLGGDSQIGRRLYRVFRNAGFIRVELSVQPEVHWHGSPLFAVWIDNIIGNVDSARRGLVESGLCTERAIQDATGELEACRRDADASAWFVWNRAVGFK